MDNTHNDIYAELFLYFLIQLKGLKGDSRKIMKKSFTRAVRDWSDTKPQMISKVVADHFKLNHPNVNPFTVNHRPRKKYGMDLILEHTTPVNVMIKNLMIIDPTIDEVKRAMLTHTGMAIISRSEDDRLRKMGYSTNRPDGWVDAYSKCNITTITEHQYSLPSN